ncbi:MAG: tRNA preQ1(34) S-adenosylmethionine ribosyltransferase-isomerase QueA [Calditrichia bacterium]
MRLSDFDYQLPKELIAQYPSDRRDESRLLVLNKREKSIKHHIFKDILDYIQPGDVFIANDTKVFPARLFGFKDKEMTSKVEVFLLRKLRDEMWEVLVKPSRKVRIGNKIYFHEDLICEVIDNTSSGGRTVEFNCNGDLMEKIFKIGHCPLPPYIKRQDSREDILKYQTIYAKKLGAVAAPTAGLHFTEELINAIREKGAHFEFVTLHVGLGTFRPVQVEDVSRHTMDSEYYEVSDQTAELINKAKQNGNRVIAVGTTSVRTLETVARPDGTINPDSGWTDKFIYPPYQFKMVDAIITNFHLPKSTLIMLVSAFASRELILKAYREAIKEKYRFYSYGDAMFIY